jgi:nitrate/TMAO reductase-like tetraheme cytochrome c subunit
MRVHSQTVTDSDSRRRYGVFPAALFVSAGLFALVSASLIPEEHGPPALRPIPVAWEQEGGAVAGEPGSDDPDMVVAAAAAMAHERLFTEDRFPSATTCKTCHPLHYKEWSVSQHAYAMVSPVFTALHGTILKRTNGTFGDFCIRCHTQVGMILGEPLFAPLEARDPVSREGITCIVCHRVEERYGKVNGRIALVEGDILQPIYGPTGNEILREVLESPEKYKVVTEAGVPGRKIHTDANRFFRLTEPGFCGSCHDVTFANGFRLEELFSHYKRSPAAANGVTCQDCHMSVNQGVNAGYAQGPAAVVGGVETRTRKHAIHNWAGPDHSVVHPGIFPHNPDAQALATISEWTEFDWEAGWGTDGFEDGDHDGGSFPERWRSIDDRYGARAIIDANLELLEWGMAQRAIVLRNGYHLGEVVTERAGADGIRFRVRVKNATDGHAAPSGFDAERIVWLHVVVSDADGATVFESGDLDPNFDLRDLHSEFVHDGKLPLDDQLFNLQSKFITRNFRGGEREQIVSVNYSEDALPFARPSTGSSVLLGRPTGTRKHRQSIEPLGHRWATYTVGADRLTGRGPYSAHVELKAGMAPANLIRDIQEVGFDFNMSPLQVVKGVGKGFITLYETTVEFDITAGDGSSVTNATE